MRKIVIIMLFVATSVLTAIGQNDRVVDWGLHGSANLSRPILHGIPLDIKPFYATGVEGGVFLDFNIGQSFFIRFNTIYSLQRSTLNMDGNTCPLSASSVVVPVYAAWRFGNSHIGWCFVGVGPYTEFITWGKLKTESETFNPYHHIIDIDATSGEETFAMTDSHSGFGAMLGYEMPCGLFVDLTAQMSLNDMLAFSHDGDMWVRPIKFTLGLGWRW